MWFGILLAINRPLGKHFSLVIKQDDYGDWPSFMMSTTAFIGFGVGLKAILELVHACCQTECHSHHLCGTTWVIQLSTVMWVTGNEKCHNT